MNADLVSIIQELKTLNKRLSDSYKTMWEEGKKYSEAERLYKIALQGKILELKSQGHPVTLILELSKGDENIAGLRFQRDLAERKYETTKEAIRSMRATASVFQSILKVQDEV